jgi:hypothetical protein
MGHARLLPEPVAESWIPSSEVEKGAVQQQLEHLLGAPSFRSSKRYPRFLRYVVTRALDGQADQLKERILGIEVFDRPADYDTNIDSIVRVTAAEIRKRIDQYYQDPQHGQEIRLFLPAGSYVPQFSWPGHPHGLLEAHFVAQESAALESPPSASNPLPLSSNRPSITQRSIAFAIAVLVIAVAIWMVWHSYRPTTVQQFWEPFVNSPEPTLFCIADQIQYANIRLRDAADPQRETTLPDKMVTVIIDDLNPLVNVAGILRAYGKNYHVLGESTSNLTDLRRSPSVFIGAFDNSWTLRLTAPLRFHFANDPSMTKFWIEDRANPTKREWLLDRSQQQTEDYKDYAIIARFVAPDTDQIAVVAAGIGRGGTIAAGEFLVDERLMNEVLKQVPSDWRKKNLEVVLETQLIQGRSGPPRVRAVHIW